MKLVATLREVKYFEIRAEEEIPGPAAALYSRNDTFRKFLANLDLTVQWYNKVRTTILEVEYPLIEEQLEEIDIHLKQAEESLSWKNEGWLLLCIISWNYFFIFIYGNAVCERAIMSHTV